jgi:prolyl-tRNA synthetase
VADLIRASNLWPPVRPRSIDLSAPIFKLLEAVGVARQLDLAGSFALLPLGVMIRDRIEAIIRRSFTERGFGVFMLPVLQSRAIWESSGRWRLYADSGELFRVAGRGEEEAACLGPTSEEISVSVIAADLATYRDMPARLYQSTQKFRNEISPRNGLMRAREFEMADAYTFDATREEMLAAIADLNAACSCALARMGFPEILAIPADGGDISKAPSTEHVVRGGAGHSRFVECPQCGYRADPEVAVAAFPRPDRHATTAGDANVAKVMAFRGTAKETGLLISVVIRGDLQVSGRKVVEALKLNALSRLTEAEFRQAFGVEPHALDPAAAVAASDEVLFDTSAAGLRDFTIAASAGGLSHGANWGQGPLLEGIVPQGAVAAVHAADSGLWCGACGEGIFESCRSVELGHVFELSDRYSTPMGLRFTSRDGRVTTPLMACSGIGVGRCLQALAEQFRDERGLRWPGQVAPAQVHMIVASRGEEAESRARRLRALLIENDISVLWDDRENSIGDRFRYAWALGLPHQVVVPSRATDPVFELIERATGSSAEVDESTLITVLKAKG